QHFDVVHPRVVRAQVAPGDEKEPLDRAVEAGSQPRDVSRDVRRRELDLARRRADQLARARDERSEIDTVRVVDEILQRETLGPRAVVVAEWTRTDLEVEQSLRSAPIVERQD